MRKDIVIMLFCVIYLILYYTTPIFIYEPISAKVVFYRSNEPIKMYWYGYFFIAAGISIIVLFMNLPFLKYKSSIIGEICSFSVCLIFLLLIALHEWNKWLR